MKSKLILALAFIVGISLFSCEYLPDDLIYHRNSATGKINETVDMTGLSLSTCGETVNAPNGAPSGYTIHSGTMNVSGSVVANKSTLNINMTGVANQLVVYDSGENEYKGTLNLKITANNLISDTDHAVVVQIKTNAKLTSKGDGLVVDVPVNFSVKLIVDANGNTRVLSIKGDPCGLPI